VPYSLATLFLYQLSSTGFFAELTASSCARDRRSYTKIPKCKSWED